MPACCKKSIFSDPPDVAERALNEDRQHPCRMQMPGSQRIRCGGTSLDSLLRQPLSAAMPCAPTHARLDPCLSRVLARTLQDRLQTPQYIRPLYTMQDRPLIIYERKIFVSEWLACGRNNQQPFELLENGCTAVLDDVLQYARLLHRPGMQRLTASIS